ncbi:MAG: TrpB-like pyridoxal phosphate-dependent enzyme [Vicinamibacterales bacterium]
MVDMDVSMDTRAFPGATHLSGAAVPRHWYNPIAALSLAVPPPLDVASDRLVTHEDFAWLWPSECLKIELRLGSYGKDATVPVPEAVHEFYRRYRATPLVRAHGLERYLRTTAEIYYKREDQNPGGSHKFNTALAQACYAAKERVSTLVTDTGAGQWGTALALACRQFGLNCVVFMVRKSFDEKPYRRHLMELLGARVISSPSTETDVGNKVLAEDARSTGSLGIGMSEAIEFVRNHGESRLALGCMSYYACMHQTVIGIETAEQLRRIDRKPDVLIGCVGGGSNFVGFISPFIEARLRGAQIDLIAVEPEDVPCLSRGVYRYDFADFNGQTPRIAMYTLGHRFQPPPVHAGGLRYHGKTPTLSYLVKEKIVMPRAYSQRSVFEAGRLFLACEGVLPAPESSHAVLAAIDEAERATAEHCRRVIVFCLSGHGYLDLAGYKDVLGLP